MFEINEAHSLNPIRQRRRLNGLTEIDGILGLRYLPHLTVSTFELWCTRSSTVVLLLSYTTALFQSW